MSNTGYAKSLTILKVGAIEMPDRTLMLPGTDDHRPITTPVYCYLIEHEKGLVLVDTGIAAEGLGVVEADTSLVEQLERMSITTADISYVVMTHMHLDHSAYMNALSNCRFVIRTREWQIAHNPTDSEGGYVIAHFDSVPESSVRLIDGVGDCDLFGDGSVVLVSTRGHSDGHQSVLVRLPQTGDCLIAGDAAYLAENLDSRILPGRCTDNDAAQTALRKLAILKREGCTILFGHDPYQEALLAPFPKRMP